MSSPKNLPTNLLEAIRYFSDLDVCTQFVARLRWPDGPECPRCGGKEHSYLSTRRLWKCKACKRQFSAKQGSIFEDSPLGLDKWLAGMWLIVNSKNGVSSHEVARSLGISQKSGWFLLHRIRLAMQTGSFEKLDGEIEVDETFIGGRARNMHKDVRKRKITGTGGKDKAIVAGVMKRGGEVRVTVVPDTKHRTLVKGIQESIASGSTVYSDSLDAYKALGWEYDHQVVDHAERYVDGKVHVNGIENFWALLKRGLHGTYVSVQPFHLFRYLDERMFTFNERKDSDLGRFVTALGTVAGRRLTWTELTGKK